MTQRIFTSPQANIGLPISRSEHHSNTHSRHRQNNYLASVDMVQSRTILYLVEILGVFFCAHHLWPKGITYGKPEDWEKDYRKKHAHGHSRSKSRRSNKRNSGNENTARRGEQSNRYHDSKEENPGYKRHAGHRH
ncbi:hypothetical protein QTJ16_003221 [Diplocarpon rosae]|uniref:Uncharacterized protein n=1 Tax=Diplocarpon rosae TaxID=946125 RepID=A0AAD9WDC8_9HELO|nr:hypothetical protein QTJ16_003221 [Diplocarpon rosae]